MKGASGLAEHALRITSQGRDSQLPIFRNLEAGSGTAGLMSPNLIFPAS